MTCASLRDWCNPIRPGTSIGHHARKGGTVSAIVNDQADETHLLSCLHVLQSNRVDIGAQVIQPGKRDGTPPLNMAGLVSTGFLDEDGDASIATPSGRDLDPTVMELDMVPSDLDLVTEGDLVVKVGRSTCVTVGKVTDADCYLDIQYGSPIGTNRVNGFLIQSHPDWRDPMSKAGDSGAPYFLYRDGEAIPTLVGIHTGSKGHLAFASHATKVFERLEITLYQ